MVQSDEIGIVQIYLPARDLEQSARWYGKYLDYVVEQRKDSFVVLRNDCGPNIMLRMTDKQTPVSFQLGDREFPVISMMHPDVEGLHQEFQGCDYAVGKIVRFGEEQRYVHFHVKDPYGNLIDIGNYPDR
jgi:catechol-2,3-dioxygenase